jgi:hypothetical protein
LLLLLVLPGLLLPAGARWHVCGCAAPMSAQPAACCAPSSIDEAATPSCCAGAPARSDVPALAADDCRCEWRALPDLGDDGPTASPPSDAAPALPPQLRLAIAPWTVVAPPALRAWSARQQRPPPHPFAARNLPLRI